MGRNSFVNLKERGTLSKNEINKRVTEKKKETMSDEDNKGKKIKEKVRELEKTERGIKIQNEETYKRKKNSKNNN